MSVADLKKVSRLPQGSAIPSVELLRLQFMPKNPALASASQYTGRFSFKTQDSIKAIQCEPGVPIDTIYRSKKDATHVNIPNISADHDTASKCKCSPSVAIVIEVPVDVSGDFYNGRVTVTF